MIYFFLSTFFIFSFEKLKDKFFSNCSKRLAILDVPTCTDLHRPAPTCTDLHRPVLNISEHI